MTIVYNGNEIYEISLDDKKIKLSFLELLEISEYVENRKNFLKIEQKQAKLPKR